jgi:hypothetical protein
MPRAATPALMESFFEALREKGSHFLLRFVYGLIIFDAQFKREVTKSGSEKERYKEEFKSFLTKIFFSRLELKNFRLPVVVHGKSESIDAAEIISLLARSVPSFIPHLPQMYRLLVELCNGAADCNKLISLVFKEESERVSTSEALKRHYPEAFAANLNNIKSYNIKMKVIQAMLLILSSILSSLSFIGFFSGYLDIPFVKGARVLTWQSSEEERFEVGSILAQRNSLSQIELQMGQ